ncbi:MAG: hypothetical protein PHY30_00600 [Candidatus Pacebacteria bacterium]|nr:hypothetical protein [Candidatus Paceibacterota bacterium]
MEILEKAHKYLKITVDMRRDFIIQAQKSADQGLSFIKQIITISGVIAGFGFTAIENIHCKNFFIFGEFFLFLNICFGLYFIKKSWYEDFETFKVDIKKMHSIAGILKIGLERKDKNKAQEGLAELEKFAQQERDMAKLFEFLPMTMILLILISSIFILFSI